MTRWRTRRDVIGLLQALGYPSYNVYGISYGTRLATVVMRLYEESPDVAALPPIRSVVIDGVMPTTLNQAAENPFSEQLVALRVFADCEADAACGAAFPNIRQRTIDLLDQLEAAPIETSAGTTVTLADVTGMLTGLSSAHARVAYLPLMIDELTRGVDTTFQGVQIRCAAAARGAEERRQSPGSDRRPRDRPCRDGKPTGHGAE